MSDAKQFAVIGGGTMGETFARSLLANEIAPAAAVTVCEVMPERQEMLQDSLGVPVTADAAEAIEGAPVIFMSVKPQDFESVASKLKGLILPEQLVVSIMAGVRLPTLRGGLGHRPLVRAMPNTPAQIGKGLTVWTSTDEVSAEQRKQVRRMLATMGEEIYVDEESTIDRATAVSGSGPGFFFLLLEAMIDGGVMIGLSREQASKMVIETALGAAAYAKESGMHPAELRDMVTSPGGTTAAGLLAMERHGARAGTIEAIIAAYERTRELGG